jgi:hypothetical protein
MDFVAEEPRHFGDLAELLEAIEPSHGPEEEDPIWVRLLLSK